MLFTSSNIPKVTISQRSKNKVTISVATFRPRLDAAVSSTQQDQSDGFSRNFPALSFA